MANSRRAGAACTSSRMHRRQLSEYTGSTPPPCRRAPSSRRWWLGRRLRSAASPCAHCSAARLASRRYRSSAKAVHATGRPLRRAGTLRALHRPMSPPRRCRSAFCPHRKEAQSRRCARVLLTYQKSPAAPRYGGAGALQSAAASTAQPVLGLPPDRNT